MINIMTRQRISNKTLSNVLVDVVLVSQSIEKLKEEEECDLRKTRTLPNMLQRYNTFQTFPRKKYFFYDG